MVEWRSKYNCDRTLRKMRTCRRTIFRRAPARWRNPLRYERLRWVGLDDFEFLGARDTLLTPGSLRIWRVFR
jgi:hypothetical protein